MDYKSASVREVLGYFKSSEKGLSSEEARKRRFFYGSNFTGKAKSKSGVSIFLSQFVNPLVFVLIMATVISYVVGERIEATVIIAIVLMNSVLGFIQEFKAEKVIKELMKYIPIKVKVLRDNNLAEIDSRLVVPGDIIHLGIGDIIPADAKLLYAEDLSVDESLLTGESLPAFKKYGGLIFSGTSIAGGYCRAVVVATGMNTEFGRIKKLVVERHPETEFQKGIREFGNFLLKIILIMTLFVFLANTWRGEKVIDSFLFALALAVGITPEMLPMIITVTLSNGALKMAKKKVIVKKLSSIEDLGNVDILCCDKTGTLTEGRLSLIDYVSSDGLKDNKLVIYGLLCNDSNNQIDKAINESSKLFLLKDNLKDYVIIDKNEFDFNRRRMSTVVKKGNSLTLIAKGAFESIIGVCSYVSLKGSRIKLTKRIISNLAEKVKDYEMRGCKTIAIAEKPFYSKKSSKKDEINLIFRGLLLFIDPPKKTVEKSLKVLQKLGVVIKLISGDSPLITRKICNDVKLDIAEDKIVTGDELEKLSIKEFERYCDTYNVFARIAPEQKRDIIATLSREKHIVGFLGDGVNDAPALKSADVGISVDTAAGVARESADILILQKSLGVLADGITEGRKTFGNVMKYIFNTISANFGNMTTVMLSSLFLKFIPLLPSQILLNNFMSDIPLLAVPTDNVDEDLLKKPKRWNIDLIGRFMARFGIISTVYDFAFILPLLFIFNSSQELFRTAWFAESCLSEIIITFAIRTRKTFFRSMPSPLLIFVSIITSGAAVLITYTRIGTLLFEFVNMPVKVVILMVVILILYFATAEILKKRFFSRLND